MDERKDKSNMDPWDPDFYETGSTKPPKSHGGLVAVLLTAVIFLGGISSALGILNIRLVKEVSKNRNEDSVPMSFHDITTAATEATEGMQTTEDSTAGTTGNSASLVLQDTTPLVENIPQAGGLSLQSIYEKAIHSVVSILCVTPEGQSSGTGVILTADGYIVTNAHVVSDARSVAVLLHDDREMDARVVGADGVSDLAVLHVQATDLTPAEFGDSSTLRVGDVAIAIGDPLGVELRGTMTDGIISAINRNITTGGRTMTVIQTNAALNSGNSGGPLLNCYGQVVGINTMKIGDYVNSGGVEGLGFAIPSTTVKEIVDQLIAQGYVSGRPTLGITGDSVSRIYQRYYGMPAGLYITEVKEGTDADAAGIAAGDILLAVDGTRVTGEEELNTALYAYQAGETVEVVIYRGGYQYTARLTLSEATG